LVQFGQQLVEHAFTRLCHTARHQGARDAARPATLHQLLYTLGSLDDEFVALEVVGRGRDASRADFNHRRRPLDDLTARL
jgi:hypothetical protein